MSSITEFILARVAEDERQARAMDDDLRKHPPSVYEMAQVPMLDAGVPERVLAECEAKRRIVAHGPSQCGGYEHQEEFGGHHYPDPDWAFCDGCSAASAADADRQGTLQILAAIWADHPDYDEAWRLKHCPTCTCPEEAL